MPSVVKSSSDAHAAHALAGAAHVLLSVNCHLWQHVVLLELFVAGCLSSTTVCSLHAVGRVRLLGAGSTRSLCLATATKLVSGGVTTLDALHLILRASSQSARLRAREISIAPLRGSG